jgi:hypothetical protein
MEGRLIMTPRINLIKVNPGIVHPMLRLGSRSAGLARPEVARSRPHAGVNSWNRLDVVARTAPDAAWPAVSRR